MKGWKSIKHIGVLGLLVVVCVASVSVCAGEIGIRKDGSVIYTREDGSWIVVIPTKNDVMVAVNKRDHKLWSNPAVQDRLEGRDPENLSSKEAKAILKDMREKGRKKYTDEIGKVAKTAREVSDSLKAKKKEAKNKKDEQDNVTKQWLRKVAEDKKKKEKKKDAGKRKNAEKEKSAEEEKNEEKKQEKEIYGGIGLGDLPPLKKAAEMTDAQQQRVEEKMSHYVLTVKAKIRDVNAGTYTVRDANGEREEFDYRIKAERPIIRKVKEEKTVYGKYGKKGTKTVLEKKRVGTYYLTMYTNNANATKLKRDQVSKLRGLVTSYKTRKAYKGPKGFITLIDR